MANQDAAFGLRPVRKIDGSALDDTQVLVWAPSSYATALFVGSPVKMALDSNASAVTGFLGGDQKAGQMQEVTLSGAGEVIDFVITGFVVDASTENLATYRGTASTNRIMTAIPVANVVFEIQADGTNAVTDVGEFADITAESGSTTTGFSTVELDSSNAGTGDQLRIIGVSYDPKNSDISSANPNLYVTVNESHWYAVGTPAT